MRCIIMRNLGTYSGHVVEILLRKGLDAVANRFCLLKPQSHICVDVNAIVLQELLEIRELCVLL